MTLEALEPRLLLSGGLLVSEFMADNDTIVPDGDGAYADWVEIHNPTASEITLGGWYLTDDSLDLPKWPFPNVTIEPGQYMLVFCSDENVDDYVDAGGYLHASFALRRGGEYLGLVKDVAGTPTVVHDYGTAYPAQYTDFSYGLASDFVTEGFFTAATPESANTHAPVSDPTRRIVITEIMYHPASENDLEEYIEISNQGQSAVNLNGWRFDDGVEFTFPDITLDVGEYHVVAADLAAFSAKYPTVANATGNWTGHLANGGERIDLLDALGGGIDRVDYADEGDWARRELGPTDHGHRGWQWVDDHDGGGKSLELITCGLSNAYGQNWSAGTPDEGTPGAVNSVAAADIAPIINDVSHWPIVPSSTDPVTVTAEVIDELAAGVTVTLHYRLDGAPAFTQAAMLDDGAGPDAAAGDGVYAASIDAQADGTIVEFYVEAEDAAALARTWPAPSEVDGVGRQVTNALYLVDDSHVAPADRPPGTKPTYAIIMTETERAELADIGAGGGDQNSDAQMNATFISVNGSDVEARYIAGVRNRGHGSRGQPPNNYRVNFANDRPWKSVTRVTINSKYTNSQLIGMTFFRMAGLPASDALGVQVLVNGTDLSARDSRMHGTYVHIEVPDSDFTDRHFPGDGNGNLYKILRNDSSGQQGDFRYEGTDPDAYRDTYFKLTNEDTDDWSDLIHMTDMLNNAPDETFLADVSEVIHVDQWLRWMALDALMLNRETGIARGQGDDFLTYRGITDPRFVLIPHDLDSLMHLSGDGAIDQSIWAPADGVSGTNGVEAISRLLHHPDVTPLYYKAFLDLIDEFFNPAVLNPLIDQVLGPLRPPGEIADLKGFIVDRTAAVLAQIPQEFTVTSELPVVGGYHQTSQTTATITGIADVSETRLVLVNGQEADWSPRQGTWSFGQGGGTPTVVSFQDGVSPDATYAGTVDTEIRFSDPTVDLSTAASLNVDGADAGGQVQALLRFDDVFGPGSGQVALDAEIVSATLTLNVTDAGNNMALHRMLGSWAETANWNAFADGIQADGVEAAASADATASGSAGTVTVDVTAAVKAWQADPSSNHGWVLLPGGTNGVDFDSREHGTAGNRPKLSVSIADETLGTGGTVLNPGINRIVVETFGNSEGAGLPLETGHVDVWYEPSLIENIIPGGNVSGEWSPTNGIYHVTGNITIPAGQTLTIQPGTAVYFDPGTRLTVNGRLLAEGLESQRITLTRYGTSGAWNGIVFNYGSYSDQVNRIAYTDFDRSDGGSEAILANDAQLVLENVDFTNQGKQFLDLHDSSIIARNCTFPDASGELIHFTDFPEAGYAIFNGNYFGRASGYNDVIDLTSGQRPGPIAQFTNNYFAGGGDDGLDLDSADAHIEGNVFVDFHQDASRASKSHAIATGNDLDQTTEVTIVRNLFYDVDHAILIKDGAFGTIVNNTIVKVHKKYTATDATTAAINLFENRPPQYEGNGVTLDGNIFYDISRLFENEDPVGRPVAATMNNTIVHYTAPVVETTPWVGTGNLIGVDPLLTETVNVTDPTVDFALQPGSPAIGTGPNGVDMGGLISAGATIDGEPIGITDQTTATITVGGPEIYGYRYRVNDGPWSDERSPVKSVESITRTGTTAAVTITAHGYGNGDVVEITGPKEQEYNGTFTIGNVTADTFDVTVIGAPTSPATGEIVARRVEPIELTGLTPGIYTVFVIAKNSAGIWQAEADATASDTWTVDAPGGPPSAGAGTDTAPAADATPAADPVSPGNVDIDTTFTAADGPYTFTGDVVVDPGVTLTIEPGATLFFQDGVSLTVNGRLLAEGTTYEQIRFTHVPGGNSWGGLQLLDTMEDNRVSHAVFEYATTADGMIGVENANLRLDHVTLDHAERRRIRVRNSSLIVRNSTFTDMFAMGQSPLTDNGSEHIWGGGIPTGGHLVIENNVFGTTTGHNDAIDVDGEARAAGGAVMQILNNTFAGGGDDALDLEGDAYVEGNTFAHFRKDQWNTGTGDANVISAGGGHDYVVVRNTFRDVDHVAQIKDGAFLTLVNNTLVDAAASALYFVRPGGSSAPGRGAYVDGNIFAGTAVAFDEVEPTTDLVAHRTVMPAAYHGYGTGNIDEEPRLADPAGGDFSLLPGSPARGTGPNGLDIGAMVPAGPSITGEPPSVTAETAATLTIAGPGVTDYTYRVNGGAWRAEETVDTPIELTALADGDYTVDVIGKTWAGVWQDEADAAVSRTWTVDTSLSRVRINEVLATNTTAVEHEGTYPDIIELHNDGAAEVVLDGMSISDNPLVPDKYVFGAGASIPAGQFLLLYADRSATTSGLHTGFALSGSGEGVYLYDTAANGRTLLDSVEFGLQIEDLSIGRVGHQGDWSLTAPTLGSANAAHRTGDPAALVISEWFARGEVRLVDDFLELHNPDPLPVSLGGLYLSDLPAGQPDRHEIPALSFVAGGGFVALTADGDADDGADHLGFRLAAEQEAVGLFASDLSEIDKVLYFSQTTDTSQGRYGDTGQTYSFFRLPTPGVSGGTTTATPLATIAIDDVWSYNATGADLGTAWRQVPEPDPTGWQTGSGVFGLESAWGPDDPTINTPLSLGPITYYFRTHVTVDADPDDVVLTIRTWLDDGAIIHLNGSPAWRIGMDSDEVDYMTLAGRNVPDAVEEGPFTLPTDALVRGDNVLAVEVHQTSGTSSDIIFGMTLEAVEVTQDDPVVARGLDLLDGLRVTELMYHPDDGELEFVEVRNISDEALDIGGVRLRGGIDFTFPPMALAAGQYAVAVREIDAFTSHYGSGINVAGQYDGNLSNGGEDVVLGLPDPLDAAILRFEYDDTWYPTTDGGGYALAVTNEHARENRWSLAEQWTAGDDLDGSPGRGDGQTIAPGIVINEVLSHTDAPLVDAIELHNPTGEDITIGGWWLTDSSDDFLKFQIPPDTIVPAGRYRTFHEGHYVGNDLLVDQATEFGGTGADDFALNGACGDDVWLVQADPAGNVTQVVDYASFGPAANGESAGRWPDGSGDLYPMIGRTFDAANSGPRVGPTLISEVHYHPAGSEDLAFIEITNPTGATVDLWETYDVSGSLQDYPWRIEGFTFATGAGAGTSLGPGESLVVVSFDPVADPGRLAAFETAYGLGGSGVQIVGPFEGELNNAGETVRLERPDEPPIDETDFVPYLLVDEVIYDDQTPWPTSPDGQGDSLNRIGSLWGNDPASWQALSPTPGRHADSQPPTLNTWYSAAVHDGTELLLEVSDDGSFSEPRAGGIHTLVVDFSEPVNLSAASVVFTGNGPDGQVGLSLITAAVSSRAADRGQIVFSQALPDVARYAVRLEGVTDTSDNALVGDNDRIMVALAGDVNGDLVSNVFDVSAAWSCRDQSPGAGADQTRADVNTDGVLNSFDAGAAWFSRGHDATGFEDPVVPAMAGGSLTASSPQPHTPTERLVGSSGLSGGSRGTDHADTWFGLPDVRPVMPFDVGRTALLSEMHVWNGERVNQTGMPLTSLAIRTGDAYVPLTGVGDLDSAPARWMVLSDDLLYAEATGQDDYTDPSCDLSPAEALARYDVLTDITNGGPAHTGLEVRSRPGS